MGRAHQESPPGYPSTTAPEAPSSTAATTPPTSSAAAATTSTPTPRTEASAGQGIGVPGHSVSGAVPCTSTRHRPCTPGSRSVTCWHSHSPPFKEERGFSRFLLLDVFKAPILFSIFPYPPLAPTAAIPSLPPGRESAAPSRPPAEAASPSVPPPHPTAARHPETGLGKPPDPEGLHHLLEPPHHTVDYPDPGAQEQGPEHGRNPGADQNLHLQSPEELDPLHGGHSLHEQGTSIPPARGQDLYESNRGSGIEQGRNPALIDRNRDPHHRLLPDAFGNYLHPHLSSCTLMIQSSCQKFQPSLQTTHNILY